MSVMTTPARIMHALAGSPEVPGCTDDRAASCYVCAEPSHRTKPVTKWMGNNFTDQARCLSPGSDRICEACAWACSWVTPPGYVVTDAMAAKKAAKRAAQQAERDAAGKGGAGKEVGENLRLFSHLYSGGIYAYAKKDSKPDIYSFLRRPKNGPWFAAVADSGQKHTVPFATLNYGAWGGEILFEDRTVQMPRNDDGWRIADDMEALLTAGATKDEVTRGEYRPDTWIRCGEQIRAFEDAHGVLRGGAFFALIVWLVQRDEAAVAARQAAEKAAKETKNGKRKKQADTRAKAATASGDRRRHPRVASAVPSRRSEPAEALGAAREPHPVVDAHDDERRGVGDRDEAGPAPLHYEQISLFGGGEAS